MAPPPAYVLICLLYGDKGAIATLWVISVIMGSVGGACLDNTLAGVVDYNALGWSLASIGFTLAYAIPLVLLSLWSRKCWPFVLSAGFLVFGIVVGATGTACVGTYWWAWRRVTRRRGGRWRRRGGGGRQRAGCRCWW